MISWDSFRFRRFPATAAIGLTLSSLPLLGQEMRNANGSHSSSSADPFAEEEHHIDLTEWANQKTASALLRLEVYELPALLAIELFDQGKPAAKMRAHVLKLVRDEKASISSVQVLRSEMGLAMSSESRAEEIYPTEYEPPESIPADSILNRPDEQLSPADRQAKVALSFATPSAFDTKLTGVTVEAEAALTNQEKNVWNLRLTYIALNHSTDRLWVENTIKMPLFQTQELQTSARVKDGIWHLWAGQSVVDDKGAPDPKRVRVYFVKLTREAR